MNNKIVLLFAIFVLFFGIACASTVSRSFSSTSVEPGADLTVTLTVEVTGNESYYAIDELVPEGWIVKDSGSGSAEHQGHIKWVAIDNAENTTNTYTLTAPNQIETAIFNGTYMFEGMGQEAEIAGAKQANVIQEIPLPVPAPAPHETDYTIPIVIGAIIAVIIIAVVVFEKKKTKAK